MMSALTDFRDAYSALLLAAERLRLELDPTCGNTIPRDIRTIQAIVCSHFGVPLMRLLSGARDEDTVIARHAAMLICREITTHNTVAVGDAFNRDHGAVPAGVASIKVRFVHNPKLRAECEQLRDRASAEIQRYRTLNLP